MKRKIISLFLCLLIIGSLSLTASATSGFVIDQAGLLTSNEIETLEADAQAFQDTYGLDLVYLTVNSLNGKFARDYADDYYDENGYGEDGVLFLLAMEEREWYISTSGSAIYALTDYGLTEIENTVVPYLSNGQYYEAFCQFQATLPRFLDAYDQGHPVDGYVPGYRENVVYYEPQRSVNLPLSLVIGFIAAAAVVLIMCSSMNTKRKQYSAGDYLKRDSYRLRLHRDMFLYSNVSKVRRQEENHGGGHRGGGSSTHRSSGGRSHGGRGGRF